MDTIKKNWKFLLFVGVIGIIGGIFTSFMLIDYLDAAKLDKAVQQVGSITTLQIIAMIQCLFYALFCGGFGLILSNKAGLWKPLVFQTRTICKVAGIAIASGIVVALIDIQLFAGMIEQVAAEYQNEPKIVYALSAFTYGAVIEEVMLRLFLMSLIAFGTYKLFCKKGSTFPVIIYIIANIITAAIFALGHLPATSQLWGDLSFPVVMRCFLFNGTMGLFFGFIYRKHGIHYAMLAHLGAHVGMQLVTMLNYLALR